MSKHDDSEQYDHRRSAPVFVLPSVAKIIAKAIPDNKRAKVHKFFTDTTKWTWRPIVGVLSKYEVYHASIDEECRVTFVVRDGDVIVIHVGTHPSFERFLKRFRKSAAKCNFSNLIPLTEFQTMLKTHNLSNESSNARNSTPKPASTELPKRFGDAFIDAIRSAATHAIDDLTTRIIARVEKNEATILEWGTEAAEKTKQIQSDLNTSDQDVAELKKAAETIQSEIGELKKHLSGLTNAQEAMVNRSSQTFRDTNAEQTRIRDRVGSIEGEIQRLSVQLTNVAETQVAIHADVNTLKKKNAARERPGLLRRAFHKMTGWLRNRRTIASTDLKSNVA